MEVIIRKDRLMKALAETEYTYANLHPIEVDKTCQLAHLQSDIHEIAKAHGWWDPELNRPALSVHMLIVSEVAEASEAWRRKEAPVHFDDGKPEGEAVELADALIRILDYAGHMGWDMENIVKAKMSYNASRSYRHGGKRA